MLICFAMCGLCQCSPMPHPPFKSLAMHIVATSGFDNNVDVVSSQKTWGNARHHPSEHTHVGPPARRRLRAHAAVRQALRVFKCDVTVTTTTNMQNHREKYKMRARTVSQRKIYNFGFRNRGTENRGTEKQQESSRGNALKSVLTGSRKLLLVSKSHIESALSAEGALESACRSQQRESP